MQVERMMLCFAVFLALLGSISCQYGAGTSSGSYVVTASGPGRANYRVLSIESKANNFLRMNPDGSFTGFLWDLLNVLKATMDFNFTLSIQADEAYGAPDASGKWDGMVGQLIRNETDTVLSDFTITSQRLSVVDFTVPFMPVQLVTVTQPNASLTDIKYAIKASSATFIYIRGSPVGSSTEAPVGITKEVVSLFSELSGVPFKDSSEPRARQIWASMQANLPTSLVRDNDDGLALVQQGGWAFVNPDAAIAVAVKNSNGRLVINRPAQRTSYYGIGVQLGSPLRKPLSIAVTKIMATGQIQELLSKWDLAV